MDEQRRESPASRNEDQIVEPGTPQQAERLLGAPSGPQLSLWPAETLAPPPPPSDSLPVPPPDREPPWTLGDLFAFILFAAFSFIFANLLAVVIFSALQRQFSWQVDMAHAFTATPWIVSMQTGWEILWLLFIYITVSKKYQRRFWQAIKWAPAPRARVPYLLAGIVLAFAAQSLFSLFP